ncbi:GNAT family N-acetyltransferase [Paenibacillus sp. LjRoot153]|uniref:GNAT family N-acetyltransferase n=1 Tax=Paenibacillus sp. LjRoot153 TaxID=3342270 RepID=UPI003F4F4183
MKNLFIFCIDQNENPIGIFSANVNDSHARIPTIAVSRNWQKQGVGKILLSEALRQLKDVGVSKVRLTVDSTNEVAKSLYKKTGFVHEYKRTNLVITF